ncbi:Protein of unknown function [Gryllus bimaculatus]|nr:Protein of unknown function [Gryllus bimaculatus]
MCNKTEETMSKCDCFFIVSEEKLNIVCFITASKFSDIDSSAWFSRCSRPSPAQCPFAGPLPPTVQVAFLASTTCVRL